MVTQKKKTFHKEHLRSNTCKIYVKYKLMSCSHTQECHWKGSLYNFFNNNSTKILKNANHTISSLSKIKCSMMLVIWERSVKKRAKSSKILINQPRECISEEQIMLHAHMEFISQKLFASWVFHTWYGDILQFYNHVTENVFYWIFSKTSGRLC